MKQNEKNEWFKGNESETVGQKVWAGWWDLWSWVLASISWVMMWRPFKTSGK